MLRHLLAASALALVAACGTVPSAQAPPRAAAEVLAEPARLPADRDQDARRKAAETLAFMQVKPGASVFDMEAGGGYWTELLARAAGPAGRVAMQNPAGFIPFVKDTIDARLADGRLPTVRRTVSRFDALDAASGSVDLVTWVQGPHDLFYRPEGVVLGEPAASFAEVARILKPGGALVVVDHSAAPGAPETTGGTLHRIDPAITIRLAEAAGLKLEARGDFLANPADDRTTNVFDPAIRGRTDQHVLRFRKPR